MQIDKTIYSRNLPLNAILEIPDNNKSSHPIVILCHGHSRHKDDGLAKLSNLLSQNGYASIRADFRGCGENVLNRYSLYAGTDWPEDLMNIISFVGGIPIIDKARIGVAGISMGASTAVYTTGMDSRIKSTVSMAGIGDCKRWLRWVWEQSNGDFEGFVKRLEEDSQITAATGHSQVIHVLDMYNKPIADRLNLLNEGCFDPNINTYVTLNALWSLLHYRPLDKCSHISSPILFIHGENDDIVPQSETESMFQAVGSTKKRMKIYPNVTHNVPIDPLHQDVFDDIITWFKETL